MTTSLDWTPKKQNAEQSLRCRDLLGACLAHLLHDGYTDLLYVLLPVWQAEFGLSYAGLAAVRALYSDDGRSAGAGRPAHSESQCAQRFGAGNAHLRRRLSRHGLFHFDITGLCIGLVLAGIGSSVQHPCASLLVTKIYGKYSRGPLGVYISPATWEGDLSGHRGAAVADFRLAIRCWHYGLGRIGGRARFARPYAATISCAEQGKAASRRT